MAKDERKSFSPIMEEREENDKEKEEKESLSQLQMELELAKDTIQKVQESIKQKEKKNATKGKKGEEMIKKSGEKEDISKYNEKGQKVKNKQQIETAANEKITDAAMNSGSQSKSEDKNCIQSKSPSAELLGTDSQSKSMMKKSNGSNNQSKLSRETISNQPLPRKRLPGRPHFEHKNSDVDQIVAAYLSAVSAQKQPQNGSSRVSKSLPDLRKVSLPKIYTQDRTLYVDNKHHPDRVYGYPRNSKQLYGSTAYPDSIHGRARNQPSVSKFKPSQEKFDRPDSFAMVTDNSMERRSYPDQNFTSNSYPDSNFTTQL